MPEKTDEEIAKQAQLGDAESFGILIERFKLTWRQGLQVAPTGFNLSEQFTFQEIYAIL